MANTKLVQQNLKVTSDQLTDVEESVLQEVMEKFMLPLNNASWGYGALDDFRKSIAQ